MLIISHFMSFLLAVYPPEFVAPPYSAFLCDGDQLEASIYNNQDGAYKLVKSSQSLDAGSFVILLWRDLELMLPRTFNEGETSFTDGKWWWSYEDAERPRFRLRKPLGEVQDIDCQLGEPRENVP